MTERIAFLGIGLMGAPMAANLLKAGFPVTVWNRTPAKAENLRASGATVSPSAAEAVRDADIIVTMLTNGPAVDDVLFGTPKVAAAIRKGALVIDMSSIPPPPRATTPPVWPSSALRISTRRSAAVLAARKAASW